MPCEGAECMFDVFMSWFQKSKAGLMKDTFGDVDEFLFTYS